jgi:hypothetical protein
MVTGNTFMAMMENTALRHVPMGTIFQLDDISLHAFWTWNFLIIVQEEGNTYPGSFVVHILLL